MSLSSQGSHFQTAGGTCRWCGVKPRRRWPVCALPLLVHAFPLLRLCLCPFSLAFLATAASSTAFPSLLLLHALLFYTNLFSLCPSLSLLPWLLSFFWIRWGGKRTDGRYSGLWYSCHSSLSSLPLKSLSLSSLQLTAARGKSCWTSAGCTPSSNPVWPVIVYLRSWT